jgi:RNA polymerase sigma factor (sigma-70 family)
MAPSPSFDPAFLATHVAFVRRLARGLVQGDDAADELAAEALAAAVVQRPEMGASFRGWLRRVTSRLARRRVLADEHRLARERIAARSEREPSADELAAQIELERKVALTFTSLDEPLRTTLFRRFWLDRTPSEIAAETATPLPTVKSRLQRGLALLRERLDAEHGGKRGEWMAALGPWISSGGTVVATAISVKGKVVLAAAALLLAVGGGVALLQTRLRASRDDATRDARPGVAPAAALDAAGRRAGGADRAASSDAAERALDPAVLPFAAGLVVDGAGAPIEGVRVLATRMKERRSGRATVRYEAPLFFEYGTLERDMISRSDARGRFAVPEAGRGGAEGSDAAGPIVALRFAKEGFALVEFSDFAAERTANQELRIVLAPSRRVRGVVRESNGSPLAGASIRLEPIPAAANASAPSAPQSAPMRIARHLPGAPEYFANPAIDVQSAATGADGRFDLFCAPAGPFQATADARGFTSATVAADALPDPWEPVLVRTDLLIDVVDADTQAPITGACGIVIARGPKPAAGTVEEIACAETDTGLFAAPPGEPRRRVGSRLELFVNYPHGGLTWLLIAPDQTIDVTIHVAAPGYHTATIESTITQKSEPPHLRAELVRDEEGEGEPSIAGRVAGAPDPSDVEVALFAVQSAVHGIDPTDLLRLAPHMVVQCDADGVFAFRELPPAGYLLIARAKGCAPVRADVTAPCRDVLLTLESATTLAVAVVDRGGRAVQGALVHVQDERGKAAWRAVAGDDGVARFEKLPSGRLHALAIAAPADARARFAFGTGSASPLDPALFAADEGIDADASTPARLAVHPVERRSVALELRHDDGTPARDAKVEYCGASHGVCELDPNENARLHALAVEVDSRGDAKLELYPGEHWFLAAIGRLRESSKIVVPRDRDASATFRLPDERPTGTVRGRLVEFGSGEPIVGRDLKAFAMRPNGRSNTAGTATSDHDGRFEIASVPSGDVVVEVMADCVGGREGDGPNDPKSEYGRAERRTTVEAGRATTIDFELPPIHAPSRWKTGRMPAIALAARVVDAASGAPLAGATISVQIARDETTLDVGAATTGADGRAAAEVLAADALSVERYVVWVMGPYDTKAAAPTHHSVKLELAPSGGALTVDVELARRE